MQNSLTQIPPNSLEIEQAVLASLLTGGLASYSQVSDTLDSDSFYHRKHVHIFNAVVEIAEAKNIPDIVTVSQRLKERGTLDEIGGRQYITDLSMSCATVVNLPYHSRQLNEFSARRALIRESERSKNAAFDLEQTFENVLEAAQKAIVSIVENKVIDAPKSIIYDLGSVIAQIRNTAINGQAPGLRMGFTELDALMHGMQDGNLITVAARPGMGKTAFMLDVAETVASEEKTVAIFSLEMTKEQLITRMISSSTEIPHDALKSGNISGAQLEEVEAQEQKLGALPIYMFECPGARVRDVAASCRRLRAEKGKLDLIIIDHFHMLTASRSMNNEVSELTEMTRQCKHLALELGCPVMLLAQLSRQVEMRQDKRPMLSDLRGTGSLEQDSDCVLFLYRDEYYFPFTDKRGELEVIVSKNRHGGSGTVTLWFNKNTQQFFDPKVRNLARAG